MQLELAILGRLLVAGVLAGALGWEREKAGKPAGLRTHILVGIGAALYTGLAELSLMDYSAASGEFRSDPIRVIQAVAVGIGFLGAGAIHVAPSGERVRGLTTAASIWATAAMGIAAGLAHYVLAGGATLIMLVVLRVLGRLEQPEGS